MSLIHQVMLGTVVFGLCAGIHIVLISYGIPLLGRLSNWANSRSSRIRVALLLGASFCTVVASHTVQIWLWAVMLLILGAFSDIEVAFYYAVVTYTTLGYGDVVLSDGLRIFGAFGGVTGVLTLGVSTAFLIGVIVRVLPKTFGALK